MDRQTQLNLIAEVLELDAANSAYLDVEVTRAPVEHYLSPEHFAAEQKQMFRRQPFMAAHSSELAEPGSFLRLELAGQPVLLARGRDGKARAFLNVCRHRGARLVDAGSGCKNVFSCPYHGWTWDNQGNLRGVPHQEQGFPGLEKSDYGLIRLPCREAYGFLWVTPDPDAPEAEDSFWAEIAPDLEWLDPGAMQIAHSSSIDCAANWKLLIEGGIEAYHFKVAHKDTIGPYFPDNLSTYQMFGAHMRSVLPRLTMLEQGSQPPQNWDLRRDANIVYTLFPSNQFLVQQDHIGWIQMRPLAADRTMLRLTMLVPGDADAADPHWARNHKITTATLQEDFAIGESVQAGLGSGANAAFTFGRYEGALASFARQVAQAMAQ